MPLPLLALAGGGAGLGLIKSLTLDRAREDRQRKLAAETARYSPWTKMTPGAIEEADPFGSAMQGGFSGAALGQNIAQMGGGGGESPWGGMSGGEDGVLGNGNYAMPDISQNPMLAKYLPRRS